MTVDPQNQIKRSWKCQTTALVSLSLSLSFFELEFVFFKSSQGCRYLCVMIFDIPALLLQGNNSILADAETFGIEPRNYESNEDLLALSSQLAMALVGSNGTSPALIAEDFSLFTRAYHAISHRHRMNQKSKSELDKIFISAFMRLLKEEFKSKGESEYGGSKMMMEQPSSLQAYKIYLYFCSVLALETITAGMPSSSLGGEGSKGKKRGIASTKKNTKAATKDADDDDDDDKEEDNDESDNTTKNTKKSQSKAIETDGSFPEELLIVISMALYSRDKSGIHWLDETKTLFQKEKETLFQCFYLVPLLLIEHYTELNPKSLTNSSFYTRCIELVSATGTRYYPLILPELSGRLGATLRKNEGCALAVGDILTSLSKALLYL